MEYIANLTSYFSMTSSSRAFDLQNPWRKKRGYKSGYLDRTILPHLIEHLESEQVLGIIGSRQVGKSALIMMLIEHLIKSGVSPKNIFYFNLDSYDLQTLFSRPHDLIDFLGESDGRKYVFVDEVQTLKTPGLFLKELYDLRLPIKIVYSGSSYTEIRAKTKEHLVGRVREFRIERLSFDEYKKFRSPVSSEVALRDYILYGSYPAVALAKKSLERKRRIRDIHNDYIRKDIVELLKVEDTDSFNKLLTILAHQTGTLVNLEHLSRFSGLSREEVGKYISTLEQTFIIEILRPFHRNYRKEITRMPKAYFLDLGLRNSLLNAFQPIELRDDLGRLFENFCLLQLLADDPYRENTIRFWRTTNQTEIDFMVESGRELKAIEAKWSDAKEPRSFRTIREHYPGVDAEVWTRGRFVDHGNGAG